MSVSMPGLSIPARIQEIEARLGIGRATLGNEADALVFGGMAEDALTATATAAGDFSLQGITLPPTVTPSFTGSVVNADGILADGVPFADLFRAAGATHGIQPSILAAVAKTESAFDPNATSHAGAQGLMQFMPATAADMGVDPFDPASAIDGAARYLTQNLRRFGSLELALAAYNAGPGAVQQHGGIPPFAETQAYVPKVLAAAGLDTARTVSNTTPLTDTNGAAS
jgi:soluble lytic murein transglycosylase-like protein